MSKARLDRFDIYPTLTTSVLSCDIIPYTVLLKLKLPFSTKRGSAYWQFNNSLLEDKTFCEIFSLFWSDWQTQKDNYHNICTWWDLGKHHIKSLSQMYGKKCASEKKTTIQKLEKDIYKLQSHQTWLKH